jgi:hypothetical protein
MKETKYITTKHGPAVGVARATGSSSQMYSNSYRANNYHEEEDDPEYSFFWPHVEDEPHTFNVPVQSVVVMQAWADFDPDTSGGEGSFRFGRLNVTGIIQGPNPSTATIMQTDDCKVEAFESSYTMDYTGPTTTSKILEPGNYNLTSFIQLNGHMFAWRTEVTVWVYPVSPNQRWSYEQIDT